MTEAGKEKSLAKNYLFNMLKTTRDIFFLLITFPYAVRVLVVDSLGKIKQAASCYFEYHDRIYHVVI